MIYIYTYTIIYRSFEIWRQNAQPVSTLRSTCANFSVLSLRGIRPSENLDHLGQNHGWRIQPRHLKHKYYKYWALCWAVLVGIPLQALQALLLRVSTSILGMWRAEKASCRFRKESLHATEKKDVRKNSFGIYT